MGQQFSSNVSAGHDKNIFPYARELISF
jgi:hypothetical protein